MKAAKVPKPQFPSTEEEVNKALKMVEKLNDPPKLTSDYTRQIEKATKRRKDDRLLRTTPPRLVPQLGQQKKQSISPLKVYSNTEVGPSTGAGEQIDPEFIALYGQAAAAAGMSIPQYLQTLEHFSSFDLQYQYRHGHPLIRPGEENNLPTKMRRVHSWYMKESAKSENWIYVHFKNKHFGHGNGEVMIEFEELYQLYQMDGLDKSILSAYCL